MNRTRGDGGRTWAITRFVFTGHLLYLAALWLAFAAVALAVTIGIAAFGTLSSSVWDDVAPVLRWFVLGYGVYLINRQLPICIVHGQTRREFMAQVAPFILVATAMLATLVAFGYTLEAALYQGMDWPQALSGQRLFTSPDQFGLVFTTYWVQFLVWTAAGALLAAGFYRGDEWGLATIPPAVAMVVVAGLATGSHSLPFVGRVFDTPDAGFGVTLAIGAAAFLPGAAMTWALVRDIPIRTKTA